MMRRIQIHLEEGVDEALQAEAARTGRSKAALIRECVALRYGAAGSGSLDPLDTLVGAIDVDPASVDEIVYGAIDEELEVAEPTPGIESGAKPRRP